MKKVIVILAIMIAFVGAVFAAETAGAGDAVVKVNVKILGTEPIFALRTATANNTDVGTAGQASVGVINTDAKLTTDAAAALAAGNTATVKFEIIQVSDAKMFGGYSFSVEATDLLASKPAGVSDDDWDDVDDTSKVFEIQTASADPAITVSEASHSATTGDNPGFARLSNPTQNADAKIVYLGVLKATAEKPYTIGSFSCTWDGNAKAVPADYQATVKLTVAGL